MVFGTIAEGVGGDVENASRGAFGGSASQGECYTGGFGHGLIMQICRIFVPCCIWHTDLEYLEYTLLRLAVWVEPRALL